MARNNRNKLEKHVFSDRVKWGVTVLCILLIGVFLAAACTQGFTNGNPWGWFDKKEETEKEQADANAGGGIAAPVEDDVQTMSLAVTKISPEEYDDYGIMPIADTVFTIKASYTGDVTQKELDWAIKWKSGASGQWGNGKTVTEYATISPSLDTLTLTITVKQAFGEQIVITATNRVNPEYTKTATVDYAKRVTGVELSLEGAETVIPKGNTMVFPYIKKVVNGQASATMTVTPSYTYSSVYSVEDTFSLTSLKVRINFDSFKDYFFGNSMFSTMYPNVTAIMNAIPVGGTVKDVTSSFPDLSTFDSLWTFLAGDVFTSKKSEGSTRDELRSIMSSSGFYKSTSNRMNALKMNIFTFGCTIKGKYSAFVLDETTSEGLGLCFYPNAFDA